MYLRQIRASNRAFPVFLACQNSLHLFRLVSLWPVPERWVEKVAKIWIWKKWKQMSMVWLWAGACCRCVGDVWPGCACVTKLESGNDRRTLTLCASASAKSEHGQRRAEKKVKANKGRKEGKKEGKERKKGLGWVWTLEKAREKQEKGGSRSERMRKVTNRTHKSELDVCNECTWTSTRRKGVVKGKGKEKGWAICASSLLNLQPKNGHRGRETWKREMLFACIEASGSLVLFANKCI